MKTSVMQISKAFTDCGMLNAIDGSEDHLIRVPGIENYEIGESEDEASSDEESESDESEDEANADDSDEDMSSDEE